MRGSIADKYAPTKQAEPQAPASVEAESLDDLGAFGFLRGVRDRAIMLELKHKDGRVSAFGYAWLDHVEFNPSEGITLFFGGRVVKISGRNLNAEVRTNVRLVEALLRHRVPWIREADAPAALEAGKNATVIEEINC
jgi:hypothetical protein